MYDFSNFSFCISRFSLFHNDITREKHDKEVIVILSLIV